MINQEIEIKVLNEQYKQKTIEQVIRSYQQLSPVKRKKENLIKQINATLSDPLIQQNTLIAIKKDTDQVIGTFGGRDLFDIKNPFLEENKSSEEEQQKLSEVTYIILKPLLESVLKRGVCIVGTMFSVDPQFISLKIGQLLTENFEKYQSSRGYRIQIGVFFNIVSASIMLKKNGQIWNYVEIDEKIDPGSILGIKWGCIIGFALFKENEDQSQYWINPLKPVRAKL